MHISEFKLERYFAKYEFSAPYLLCSSDPESFTVEELLNYEAGSLEKLKKCWLGYPETTGIEELRKEISKLYKGISPEDIIVHSGGEEGIFLFMNAMLNPDDHVIAHFPAYQSLYEIARSCGCEITFWKVKEEDNWELDIDFLKKNIKENTKAIIINCPHNPTGYLPSKEKFEEIIKIAKEKNILVFCDEAYRFLEYNEKDRLPAVCEFYENAVSLGIMTKAFALPGIRIGWLATKNKKILEQIAIFKEYTTIASNMPGQLLAVIALRNKEKILKRNLQIIQSNLKILNSFFDKYKDIFNWTPPKAGTIAFLSIKLNIDIEKFCLDLVESKGVFLLPSTVYDYGNKHFRIGFGRKNMKECLEKFEEYLVLMKVSVSV